MQSNSCASNKPSSKGKGQRAKSQGSPRINREDVLLGRGKCNFKHIGNMAYRILIDTRLDKYITSDSRSEKTHMVVQVVETITEAGGRFLKQEGSTDNWFAVDKKTSREKVGHSFRDAIKARTCTAVRVEEKLDPSITVKSSFAEILAWLTFKNTAIPTKSPTVAAAAVGEREPELSSKTKLTRPKAIISSHRSQSDSAVSLPATRKTVKRKLPSASLTSQNLSLEQMSRRAAETYMRLSEEARINVARRAVASAEEFFVNNPKNVSREEGASNPDEDSQAYSSGRLFETRTPSELSDTRSGKVEPIAIFVTANNFSSQNAPKSPRLNESRYAAVSENMFQKDISPKTVTTPP